MTPCLTHSFSKNRRGCEGGFWGRGQSHTPKRSSMYGDSINVLRKILLSSIAEFQKSLKIEAIMGLRGTLSKLAKLLRNLPKLFFIERPMNEDHIGERKKMLPFILLELWHLFTFVNKLLWTTLEQLRFWCSASQMKALCLSNLLRYVRAWRLSYKLRSGKNSKQKLRFFGKWYQRPLVTKVW